MIGLSGVQAATAASGDVEQQLLPNIDVRSDQKVAPVAELKIAALDASLGGEGFAQTDPATGGVSFVGRTDGFLTGRSAADPADIVLAYVRANKGAFGLDSQDIDSLKLTETYTSVDGVTHVTFEQMADGLKSFDTYLRGNVTKNGRLINVSGAPAPDLAVASNDPSLSADDALLAARSNVGGDDTVPEVEKRSNGADRKTTYATYAESAWLTVFPQAGNDRLAWEVQVLDADDILYRVAVDAQTGDILARQSMTAFDSNDANVWPHFPSALVTPTTVNFGTDPTWLDRSGSLGNQLIGNNTHTYVDNNGTNGYQGGEEVLRNPVTTSWKYDTQFFNQIGCPAFGCTWDSANPASKTVNRNPGAVGLFYLTNHFHDHLLQAPIGFNEASRNFEHVNSSGQGLGNDAVLAEAQDSSGINNANFATPADGSSPRMQMFMWDGTPSAAGVQYDTDGSVAADVVYHEYAHGLSNRLVGNGGGLTQLQSGAMGEGWSDFYSMDLLVAEGSRTDGAGADLWLGEYSTGVPGIFGGISRIRHQAIDCAVGAVPAQCPASGTAGSGGYTYGDLGKVGTTNGVHDGGEIWSQTMWDLRKTLGRNDALAIITGGMRLSPNAPSMLNMRDAILQSASVNGVNVNTVWSVFAARGMGFFASTASAAANAAVEDFTMPPALLFKSTAVNDDAPRGDGDGVAEPGETLAVKTTLQNLTAGPISSLTGTLSASTGTLTRATSDWPTLPAGGMDANSPAFAVTLPEDQVCTVPLNLTVSVTGPDGPVTIPVKTVDIGDYAFDDSTDVPKAIPDNNPTGVTSTFTLPGTGNVNDLAVRIGQLSHTWVGDLKITLTHGATTVVLINRIGAGTAGTSQDNIVNLVLADGAATAVDNALYNVAANGFSGKYRPEEALAAFNGQSATGAWTLTVSDLATQDVGSLQQWGIGERTCDVFGLPASQTDAASAIGQDTATVNGTHTSKGHATDYQFEWGTTTDYDQATAVKDGGSDAAGVAVSENLTGLTASTTYHYRLIALRDGVVLSKGADQTFRTADIPVAPPVDPPVQPAPPTEVKDVTAPIVKVTKAPAKKVKTKKSKAKVAVKFTSEAGATFTCKVDKKPAKACSSAFKTKVAAKGGKGKKHVIVIVAKDAAGNLSAPATVRFAAVRKP